MSSHDTMATSSRSSLRHAGFALFSTLGKKMLLQAWRKTRTAADQGPGCSSYTSSSSTCGVSFSPRPISTPRKPPLGQNAERRRSDDIHKNDTFSRWKTVTTTAAAMAPWTSLELGGSRRGQLLAWKDRFQGGVFYSWPFRGDG